MSIVYFNKLYKLSLILFLYCRIYTLLFINQLLMLGSLMLLYSLFLRYSLLSCLHRDLEMYIVNTHSWGK